VVGERGRNDLPRAAQGVVSRLRRLAGDVKELLAREIGEEWDDRTVAEASYERHNERVLREVATDRLLDRRARDGWEPLCDALGLPVPEEPFPHTNTREEWLES
jgi:hypothetical protein